MYPTPGVGGATGVREVIPGFIVVGSGALETNPVPGLGIPIGGGAMVVAGVVGVEAEEKEKFPPGGGSMVEGELPLTIFGGGITLPAELAAPREGGSTEFPEVEVFVVGGSIGGLAAPVGGIGVGDGNPELGVGAVLAANAGG